MGQCREGLKNPFVLRGMSQSVNTEGLFRKENFNTFYVVPPGETCYMPEFLF